MIPGQQPPQAAPQSQPQAPGQDAQGGDFKGFVMGIGDDLMKLQQVVQHAGGQLPPEFAQRIGAIAEEYKNLVSDLASGGQPGGQQQGPVPNQQGPMEAGAGAVKPAL